MKIASKWLGIAAIVAADDALGVADTGPARPLYAYGNSRGDRRLLAGATHPFDAGKMGRWGALRAYPRLKDEIRGRGEE